jgi:hypothetical protein
MNNEQQSPFNIAKKLVPEIESILDIKDLGVGIDKLNKDLNYVGHQQMRDASLGDIVSIASLIVGTIAFIHQIIDGHTLQDANREQIVERLLLRISEAQDLTPDAKERLIFLLIDRMM